MPASAAFPRALLQSLLFFVAATALVVVCYSLLDRPIAEFVYRQDFARFAWLKAITYPPPVVQNWSPLVLALLIFRRAWSPWTRFEKTLLVALVSLIVADQFRESLQIVFGRDWPETWIDDNPSLIGSGAYGFHWFAGNEEFGSFPSGHAARTCGFFAVWWLAYPRGRWLYGACSVLICLALVGMNYHFLGDVLGGACLGSLVGSWGFWLVLKGEESPDRGAAGNNPP